MKYTGEHLKEISFPLGGIGTGSVGLAGNGCLTDWEIFNRPSKGSINGYSHIAVRAIQGDEITARVLSGDMTKDYIGQYKNKGMFSGFGFGPDGHQMNGFPHFEEVVFDGEFPIAKVSFSDKTFPGKALLTAFNPFIPNDAENSSIPSAFFEIELENTTDKIGEYQVAFTVSNPFAKALNKLSSNGESKMITMYNSGVERDSVEYGDLTIATDCKQTISQAYWYRGSWQDSVVTFWNEFSSDKCMKERDYDKAGAYDACTLIAGVELCPNEKKRIRFVLSWNVPNNYNYWTETDDKEVKKPWKNYYATVYEDSLQSAMYSLNNFTELFERTLSFKNLLHNSSLPKEVIDAASANLSVLKSPTVLRLEDGSFYGWEGVGEDHGSCEGTCQHVWNYAYAMCFLFPELERSVRESEFKYCTDSKGRMAFRFQIPTVREMTGFRACVDGQMGAVIKCYREWKISGDNEWLKSNWDNIKKVLEYAWSADNRDEWDLNKDGVIDGRQHHTLDMELFGPSSWLEGMYLAALKAASEMAEFLGDKEKSEEYKEIFEKGYNWTKKNLFNGKYFIQKVDLSDRSIIDRFNNGPDWDSTENYWNYETNQIKYQIGEGSSIDQMLGQWHADILGLGEVFDKKQVSTALSAMMKNNFKPSMRNVVNPWRIFSVNDEAGSVICDYPKGADKPKIPVPYCEETMTGFEYSFGGLLCAEGMYEDGFKVIKAVRDRFDGRKRNPWNEFECGSNYARSMASYALIPILSGFEFDMPNKHLGFNPYKSGDFNCIWSIDGGFGQIEINENNVRMTVAEGEVTLKSLGLKFVENCRRLLIDGVEREFEFKDGVIRFDEVIIRKSLEITI